jgi:hypothetical protein
MEYDTRVEVLNNRFQVLQEMLDMWVAPGPRLPACKLLDAAPPPLHRTLC